MNLQARYIETFASCARAEIFRNIAIQKEHERLWIESATVWKQADDMLTNIRLMIDSWYAIYLAAKEASEETCMIPAYLQDNHNFEELELLFTNFDTVCKDTTRKLEEAKHRLDNEANRLEQRLTPRWDDRNAIKARIGEDAWRSNPRPKNDYALLRKEDEDNFKAIKEALEIMESIDFNALLVPL